MRRLSAVLTVLMAVSAAGAARAVTFTFSTVPGDTLTQPQASAFDAAAAAWSAALADPFVVRVQIGFRSLGGGILGQTMAGLVQGPAIVIGGWLAADATSAADASAVASLPAWAPWNNLVVTRAQAKALGQPEGAAGLDGTIEFSSSYGFSTERNGSGGIAAGTFDLVGIAMHEIGHVLGFGSSLDYGMATPSLLDVFRFGSAGVRSFTAGAGAYFSIDGGVTSVGGMSGGGAGQAQASHWATGTGGIMDPTFAPGEVRSLGAVDVLALDVLGYDVQVAEPASLLLLGFGVGAAALRRRRAAR